MSIVTQEALDRLVWLNQERRRRENEEAEIKRCSKELTIRRCQVDLGITKMEICESIAEEVFATEVEDRQQTAALNIYRREVERLRGGDGLPTSPPRILTSEKIRDMEEEVKRAQLALLRDRDIRNDRLRGYVNVCRAESTRVEGRACLDTLANELAKEFAKDPNYNPIGRAVHCGFDLTRIGRAEDYVTLHNRHFVRGEATELAPNFRNIKIKGQNLAIRALKNAHADQYALLMENPEWSRPERGLVIPNADPRRQPVIQRIRELAGDAGNGRGYALAVQGHGDDGQFYGIASYNCIVAISPSAFFETVYMSPDEHRMVDFNFQLSCATLPIERAVEVGTLLIEHARRYFGASMFRTQCSPLNSRYINIMGALGLGRYQTIEAASYDRKVTAMVWKFDTCAWKAAEVELKFRSQWFIDQDSMQEDPDGLKRPIKNDPREDEPDVANVETNATILEDPAAFENPPLPMAPVVHLFPQTMQGVQAIAHTAPSSFESEPNESNSTETIPSGTSSGLGHSESARSQSSFGTFRTQSLADCSSQSSDSRSQPGTGAFGLQDEQVASASKQSSLKDWDEAEAMQALRAEEASRAMPPPRLPNRPPSEYQQVTESDLVSIAYYSDATSESLGIDYQSSATDDPKGKHPASTASLSDPDPSIEQLRTPTTCAQEAEQPASEGMPAFHHYSEAAPEHQPTYDRKGKRPASASWEAQAKKRSSFVHQTSGGVLRNSSSAKIDPVNDPGPPHSFNTRAHHDASADCNEQHYGFRSDVNHYARAEPVISPRFGHSESSSFSPESSEALQGRHNFEPTDASTLHLSSPAPSFSQVNAREPIRSNSSLAPAPIAPAGSSSPTHSLSSSHNQAAALPLNTAYGTSSADIHSCKNSVQNQMGPHSTPTEAFTSMPTPPTPRTPSDAVSRPPTQGYELERATHPVEAPGDPRQIYMGPHSPAVQPDNRLFASQRTEMRASPPFLPENVSTDGQPQQPATTRRDLAGTHREAASRNSTGYPFPEQYKLAVNSYVKFVEGQLSKQQIPSSGTHKMPPDATGEPSPSNRQQASQSMRYGSAAKQQLSRQGTGRGSFNLDSTASQPESSRPSQQRSRHSAGRGSFTSDSTASQPESSRTNRQSLGGLPANGRRRMNQVNKKGKENVEAKPTRHTSSPLGQPGPSNSTGSQDFDHEFGERHTSRIANAAQTLHATSTHPSGTDIIPPNSITVAPALGSQAIPAAPYGSSPPGIPLSTSYPDGQPGPAESNHEMSAAPLQMPQQHASSLRMPQPQTDYHLHIPTQQASFEQVTSQQAAYQHPSAPSAACQYVSPPVPTSQSMSIEETPTHYNSSQPLFQPRAHYSEAMPPNYASQPEGQLKNEPKIRPWQL